MLNTQKIAGRVPRMEFTGETGSRIPMGSYVDVALQMVELPGNRKVA